LYLLSILFTGCAEPELEDTSTELVECGVWGPKDGTHAYGPVQFTSGSLLEFEGRVSIDGVQVPGEYTQQPGYGWFRPEVPLKPSTTYAWSAAPPCSDQGEFTTSALGSVVTDPQAAVGQTFEAQVCNDFYCSNFLWGLMGFNVKPPLWARIDRLDAETAQVEVSLGQTLGTPMDSSQDTCFQTTTHLGAWVDEAYIVLTGDELPIAFPAETGYLSGPKGNYPVPGSVLTVWDWELVFALSEAPDSVQVVSLAGTFDLRGLVGAIPWSSEPNGEPMTLEEVCDVPTSVGTECVSCPDGVKACVTTHFFGIEGQAVNDLVELAADQRENHLCQDSCENQIDDDNDGSTDSDAECDPEAWPPTR
jgi:hypothetical protein